MMRVLGVDPGITGALALLHIDSGAGHPPTLDIRDMPVSLVRGKSAVLEQAMADIIRLMAPDLAVVERVHSMPAQGVVSTFGFGLSYGLVRGVLAGLMIPTTLLDPQTWGRLVQLPVRSAEGEDSRARACQLFPDAVGNFTRKMDHGRADAALIALAGYRTARLL